MKTLAYIVGMLGLLATFLLTIVATALNFAVAYSAWDHPPSDIHIRLFGWNGLLVINALCTFIIGGVSFFTLMFLPAYLERKANDLPKQHLP